MFFAKAVAASPRGTANHPIDPVVAALPTSHALLRRVAGASAPSQDAAPLRSEEPPIPKNPTSQRERKTGSEPATLTLARWDDRSNQFRYVHDLRAHPGSVHPIWLVSFL
jgi:hypothetical protein